MTNRILLILVHAVLVAAALLAIEMVAAKAIAVSHEDSTPNLISKMTVASRGRSAGIYKTYMAM